MTIRKLPQGLSMTERVHCSIVPRLLLPDAVDVFAHRSKHASSVAQNVKFGMDSHLSLTSAG